MSNILDELSAELGITPKSIPATNMSLAAFEEYIGGQLKALRDDKNVESRAVRAYALKKALSTPATSGPAETAGVGSAIGGSPEVSAFAIPVQAYVDKDQYTWKQIMQMSPDAPTQAGGGVSNAFSNPAQPTPGSPQAVKPGDYASQNAQNMPLVSIVQTQGDSNFSENSSAVASKHVFTPQSGGKSPGGEVSPAGQFSSNGVPKEVGLRKADQPDNEVFYMTHDGDLNSLFSAGK